jgi:hypothetical protein
MRGQIRWACLDGPSMHLSQRVGRIAMAKLAPRAPGRLTRAEGNQRDDTESSAVVGAGGAVAAIASGGSRQRRMPQPSRLSFRTP